MNRLYIFLFCGLMCAVMKPIQAQSTARQTSRSVIIDKGGDFPHKLLVSNAGQLKQQRSPISPLSAAGSVDLGNGVFLLSDVDDPTSSLLEVKIKNGQWSSLVSGNLNELQKISKLVYSKFNDDFDFIFFVLNTPFDVDIVNQLGYGSNFCVSNDVQGIGSPIYNNMSEWGSSGKLKSAMFFPWNEAILIGPTLHELCHNWAAFIKPTPYMPDNTPMDETSWYNPHWGVSNAGGQLGGFKYVRKVEENSGGEQGKTLYQASMYHYTNPDGSFMLGGFGLDANGGNGIPYSDIELYLMGMKSAQELRDDDFIFDIYSGNDYSFDGEYSFLEGYFYSTTKTSHTIDDIIALNGARSPDASDSQKQFRVLTIAVTSENAVENYCDEIIRNVGWFAGDFDDDTNQEIYNFRQATKNRGSLILDGIKNSFKLNQLPHLSNITLSTGILSPGFNPYVFEYTVRVGASVETIDIMGISDIYGASVTGNVSGLPLKLDGFTDVVIQVSLTNGDSQSYTITVIRGEISPFSFFWDIDNDEQEVEFYLGVAFGEPCTIDWGDGSPEETVTGNGGIIFAHAIYFSHIYNSSGSYQVTIRGVDETVCPVIALYQNVFGIDHDDYRITQIDMRAAYQLLAVDIQHAENKELDVSRNKQLQSLSWMNGKLTDLDISQNTELLELHCWRNQFSTLDVSQNKKLEILWCPYNRLTDIDVSNNTMLREFVCAGNPLTKVDVSSNKNLTFFSVRYIQLTHLDVSNNIALTDLCASYNQFTELDVSHNTALTYLECENNLLTELDISNNLKLTWLSCNNNKLTDLDISNHTELTDLFCQYNAIPLINLYTLAQQASNIEEPFFALQTLPDLIVTANTPIAIDTVFYGVNTEFEGLWGSYTLNNGEITFHDPGEYSIEIWNPAVASFTPWSWGFKTDELPAVIQTITVVQSVTDVYLNKTETTLIIGDMEQLIATVTPADASNQSVTWSTDNSTVATIVDGLVTAIAQGTAIITATTEEGGKIASCTVTVTQPVMSVSLNKTETMLIVGETEQLTATVAPTDATNQKVTWLTDNPSVATVADGLVTAVSEGIATIIVITEDGGETAGCTVTVTQPVMSISLNKTETTLTVGNTEQLMAAIIPANATDQTVLWSSNNSAIASVDQTGNVSANAKGSARITATSRDGGYTATCTVTVTELETGTEEYFFNDLNIYPNPFTGVVYITGIVGMLPATSLRVTNATGVTLHTQQITNPDEIIHLEHLPAGLYFFTVEQGGKTKTVKIIKH